MVVAIHSLEYLERDSEEAANFVGRNTKLRLPSDRGVTQSVRGNVYTEPSGLAHRPKRLVDAFNLLPLPLDQELIRGSEPRPAAHMRQEPGRHPNGWLPLLGPLHASGPAIEHAMLGVDPAMPDRRLEGGAADRPRPGAGVKAGENKTSDMLRR